MGKITLILGGARSGKSSYAEKLAKERGGDDVIYLATSEVKDAEMQERVVKHRAQRPSAWVTIEAPRNLTQPLIHARAAKVVLLDCLTFLVANYLMDSSAPQDDPFDEPSDDPFDPQIETEVLAELDALVAYVKERDVQILVVSNEVGLGLVPAYALGRAYRDLLGRANQHLARHADEVLFLVAGIPMQVK